MPVIKIQALSLRNSLKQLGSNRFCKFLPLFPNSPGKLWNEKNIYWHLNAQTLFPSFPRQFRCCYGPLDLKHRNTPYFHDFTKLVLDMCFLPCSSKLNCLFLILLYTLIPRHVDKTWRLLYYFHGIAFHLQVFFSNYWLLVFNIYFVNLHISFRFSINCMYNMYFLDVACIPNLAYCMVYFRGNWSSVDTVFCIAYSPP